MTTADDEAHIQGEGRTLGNPAPEIILPFWRHTSNITLMLGGAKCREL